MRLDWLPISAASLIAGVTALSLGALLLPRSEGVADTLRLVEQDDGRWLGVAAVMFVAALCLTLGLPSLLVLFRERATRLGVAAVCVFSVGCIGLAGYAMLLSFFRALVIHDAVDVAAFPNAVEDTGLQVLLGVWVGGFYLGELLLAVAFLVARTTPAWVPGVMMAHVGSLILTRLAPDLELRWTIVMLALPMAAAAITAGGVRTEAPVRPPRVTL